MDKCIFKLCELREMDKNSLKIEIGKEGKLVFYISGFFDDKEYSIHIYSLITKNQFLELELGIKKDFINYIDSSDVILGCDGIFQVLDDYKIDIVRYLDNKFCMNIFFRDSYDTIGSIELEFEL